MTVYRQTVDERYNGGETELSAGSVDVWDLKYGSTDSISDVKGQLVEGVWAYGALSSGSSYYSQDVDYYALGRLGAGSYTLRLEMFPWGGESEGAIFSWELEDPEAPFSFGNREYSAGDISFTTDGNAYTEHYVKIVAFTGNETGTYRVGFTGPNDSSLSDSTGSTSSNYPPQLSGGTVAHNENLSTDTVIFDANATDQNSDPLSYSLGGTDVSEFTINQSNGEVRFVTSPDYESRTGYSITVIASDGIESATASVNVIINDVDEFDVTSPVDSDGAVNQVSENSSEGDYAGLTASATDPDGTDGVRYSLTDDAGGRFTIDPNSGAIWVADASLLDYETDPVHTIEVTATSDDGSSGSQSFEIADC